MDKVFYELKDMALTDLKEVIQKGNLNPCDYGPVGEAVDIVKDVYKIKQMEMEMGITDEDAEEMWESRMSGVPARSPRTGRFVSRRMNPEVRWDGTSYGDWEAYGSTAPVHGTMRASYHDPDGAIKADLDEALKSAKDDHTRMLIMRAMEKLDSNK